MPDPIDALSIAEGIVDQVNQKWNIEQLMPGMHKQLLDLVYEAISPEIRRLQEALLGAAVNRQFGPCWCQTAAGIYCVGQPQCKAAQDALKPITFDTPFLLSWHAKLLQKGEYHAAAVFAVKWGNEEFRELARVALRLHKALHNLP